MARTVTKDNKVTGIKVGLVESQVYPVNFALEMAKLRLPDFMG